jgi:hypothetical protein
MGNPYNRQSEHKVKTTRKSVHLTSSSDSEMSPHRRIFRSNSEVYLKPVDDMQDTEDAFVMPIAYAVDQAAALT